MRRLLLATLLLVLPACASDPPSVVEGQSTVESGFACVPASPVPAALPAGFPQPPPGAVLTAVAPEQVTGRVVAEVADVLAHFRAAVEQAGYVVRREEDEGRSAQLAFFGARGEGAATIAALTCPEGSTGFTLSVSRSLG